jgi:hypothetical protein
LLDCWNAEGQYVEWILHFSITVSVLFCLCAESPGQ